MVNEFIVKNVGVRRYVRTNNLTGESEVVTVSNRNALPVWKHLELLNLNDEGHTYSEDLE